MLEGLGLPLWSEFLELKDPNGKREVFIGLEEFREHLGGQLTILLLREPGLGVEVHQMDETILEECLVEMKERACALA